MAFGVLVKKDHSNVETGDLGSNPTSGNMLIYGAVNGSSSRTITTPPSGFTEINQELGGSQNAVWYYKVSVGTEQTAQLVWSGSGGECIYAEYGWDGSTPTVTKNADATYISTDTNSMPSGAVTPSGSTNLLVAFHVTDRQQYSSGGQAVDGSWVEDDLFNTSTGANGKLSSLVSVTGSQEATHSDTDTGDTMWGAIVALDVAAVSGDFIQSIAGYGGIAGHGGTAGKHGGIAG